METKTRPVQMAISGLAYGLGLLIGNVMSFILFRLVPANWFLFGESQVLRLLMGVLLAFFLSGLGGLLGGSIGGWSLPTISQGKGRRGYVWRSGMTFGFGYGLLIFPVFLIMALLSFYDINNTPVYVFGITFGLVGTIFGAIMGVSLGLWTVGRRFPPITRWSTAGFALGGIALGIAIRQFIYKVANGNVDDGPFQWLLLGLFVFGGLGGAALGLAYHRLAEGAEGPILPIRSLTPERWQRRWLITAGVVLVVVLLIRPVMSEVGDLLTPVDAGIAAVLDLPTTGTHWLDASPITTTPPSSHPALAANPGGRLALAWVQEETLWLQEGQWDAANQQTVWQAPITVAAGSLAEPAVALADNGHIYLAWTNGSTLFVSQCQDSACTAPVAIPPANLCARTPESGDGQPTLAVNGDTVLLVWANEAGILPYIAWAVTGEPQRTAAGCVPEAAAAPQLDNTFRLVYETEGGSIGLAQFDGANWATPGVVGPGRVPAIASDGNNQVHIAFCNEAGLVYQHNGQTEVVTNQRCQGHPALAVDNDGQVHVVWYGAAVQNGSGVTNPANVLYESVRTTDGWTPPAIVGHSQPAARPVLTATANGSLHLAWATATGLQVTAQIQYACDTADLSTYGKILYEIARAEQYTAPGTPIPFCQNRYDRLIFTPNPQPTYNNPFPPTPNGAFDVLADLIRGAQYEVLFSTMWYDAPVNNDSPGSVIAAAVADLYRNLQAHPEQYPRGLTVRLMLGNPPELAMGRTTGQLWVLLEDLRQAGIDKMVDEELGWRLEVADYEGNLPHSHVKTLIIDGKTAVAAGFNMTYDHFPAGHPSGKGGGRFDTGLQMTGPVVQATQRMFDDMWAGADERYCLDLAPPAGLPWQLTCFDRSATADHVPEVTRFYLSGGQSTAFSLYRSHVHDQADRQTEAVLAAAQQTVDIIHVQFALEMICNLNILFDVCTIDNAPDYTAALIQAAQNGAHIRLMVKPGPFEGIENNVALTALEDRLAELGLSDQLEIRYFNGPVHTKSVLIDNELLIIGSQNLHYSAYGPGTGLNEYSFAVEDPQAAADYKNMFEVEWGQATQRP